MIWEKFGTPPSPFILRACKTFQELLERRTSLSRVHADGREGLSHGRGRHPSHKSVFGDGMLLGRQASRSPACVQVPSSFIPRNSTEHGSPALFDWQAAYASEGIGGPSATAVEASPINASIMLAALNTLAQRSGVCFTMTSSFTMM